MTFKQKAIPSAAIIGILAAAISMLYRGCQPNPTPEPTYVYTGTKTNLFVDPTIVPKGGIVTMKVEVRDKTGKLVPSGCGDALWVMDAQHGHFATGPNLIDGVATYQYKATVAGAFKNRALFYGKRGYDSSWSPYINVEVQGEPGPEPPPGPDPPPPPGPTPTGKVATLVIIDDETARTNGQNKVLSDTQYWVKLRDGGIHWKKLSSDDPQASERGYLTAARAAGLPAICAISQDDKLLGTIKLPETTEALTTWVNTFKGGR